MQELALASPSDIVFCDPGDDAVLSCHLKPAISAASMEIKWWNKADLVCHYKNRQVTMNRHYEDQVKFSLQKLHNGNVSLTLRNVRGSQRGIYICEVIHGCQTIKEYIFLHICSQDFRLVVPTGPVRTDSGSDIILPAYLSPETNVVSMDIRWFKGTELIYQYKNGREMTNNDYKNRVSLSSQGLKRGNLTLLLRNVNQSDSGDYTCKLFHDRCQKTGVIHLQVRDFQKHEHTHKSKHLFGDLTFQNTPNYGGTYTEKRKYNGLTTKRRRKNSIDGNRPLMSDDSTLEKPEIEKRDPRDIVGRESGHRNTRRTREGNTATGQELSSPDMSSQVLRRLRTSESVTSVGKFIPKNGLQQL
ncbi:hypothetical protein Q8A67_024766 [Cirrhinus molitorella]|uniref:Ig-like domain-containing protein n=1 Tax=Cirrhinus molitorella TaxID=172907 RepID=A0AA88P6I4_9TELE|nr:hypothetical protein Q8A67_024766 [Cirrhinus molitorella]